jgi:hypothetical protein
MGFITQNPTVDMVSDEQPSLYYLDDGVCLGESLSNPNGLITANAGSIMTARDGSGIYYKATDGLNTGWSLIGAGGGGSLTGAGASPQVAYWSGATALTGEPGFTWTTATKQLKLQGVSPSLFVQDNNGADASSSLITNNTITIKSVSSSTDPQLQLYRVRPANIYPQSTDIIGTISYQSSNNIGFLNPAREIVTATQNHSASLAGVSFTIEACLNGAITRTQRILCDGVGNVIVGLPSLAQGATAGFFYVPSIANSPSGVPSSLPAGFVPVAVDITNAKFWGYYGGAWNSLGGGGTPAGANGVIQYNNAGAFGGSVISQSTTGRLTFTPIATAAGAANFFQINTPSDTNQTASTENNGFRIVTATRQWLAGNLATQRESIFEAPTYSFTGASTITTAATVAITNGPIAGTNATITNSVALYSPLGKIVVGMNSGTWGTNTGLFVSNLNNPGTAIVASNSGSASLIGSANSYCLQCQPTGTGIVIIGGSGVNEIWKDATPSKAVSFGMAQPGVGITDDFVISKFNGTVWATMVRITNADSALLVNTISTNAQVYSVSNVTSIVGFRIDSASGSTVELCQYNQITVQTAVAAIHSIYITNSSGTPTDGFGCVYVHKIQTSTTANTFNAQDEFTWSTATHASRKSQRRFLQYDSGSSRECMRMGADGSSALVSFFGATAAGQQTGGALTAAGTYGANEQTMLQRAYNALRTFGFLA